MVWFWDRLFELLSSSWRQLAGGWTIHGLKPFVQRVGNVSYQSVKGR